jgi:uncharacterized protein Yka (UPF0111/DUF47 family)
MVRRPLPLRTDEAAVVNRATVPSLPWWRRWLHRLVPAMPDFYGMLQAQAENLQATLETLAGYLVAVDPERAKRVNELVEQGHTLRDRNLALLHQSFVTPIDREDIYTLAMTLDHILDYVKNTVREVEVLQLPADDWMRRMTAELVTGGSTLARGLANFHRGHAGAAAATVQTREAERNIEDLYRDALADMFQGEEFRELNAAGAAPTAQACLEFVIDRIKRREVYRHLSNAADRLARAGEALRDIGIKYDEGGSAARHPET